MGVLHFLDVGHGDCSIIEHASGRVTMIDVCKARTIQAPAFTLAEALGASPTGTFSAQPVTPQSLLAALLIPVPEYVNPIAYMHAHGIIGIFRYIQSHTDMDHMDGIVDLFAEFPPLNFWDTANTCRKTFEGVSQYREKDWLLYKAIRDGAAANAPKRLTLYAGSRGAWYNKTSEDSGGPHDGLHILAPTKSLVADANLRQDFNDCSYVILYQSLAGRILFCGDSHDKTWEHILENYPNEIADVDLMIAPHHGRHSGRSWDFLKVTRPKLTLFGNAASEHLAYSAWRNHGLDYITNNQAGTIVADANSAPMSIYVARETFALRRNTNTWYSAEHQAWCLGCIV